jgi:hypothetical protein
LEVADDRADQQVDRVGKDVLPLHEAQLQTYLRLSRCKVGPLLNFNTVWLKDGIRRRVM